MPYSLFRKFFSSDEEFEAFLNAPFSEEFKNRCISLYNEKISVGFLDRFAKEYVLQEEYPYFVKARIRFDYPNFEDELNNYID